MILRRISEGIKNQDWFVVLVEIMIVVVGIFIGLQADDWNQARQERVLERQYLERIIVDLTSDVAMFQVTIDRANLRKDAILELIGALEHPEAPIEEPDIPVLYMRTAEFLFIPQVNDMTYNELVATGNLSLLESVDLKRAIAVYYRQFLLDRQWDVLLRNTQMHYRENVAGILSADMEIVIQRDLGQAVFNLSEAEARELLAKFRARDRLVNMLPELAAHQVRLRKDSDRGKEAALALIELLRAQLGSNGGAL